MYNPVRNLVHTGISLAARREPCLDLFRGFADFILLRLHMVDIGAIDSITGNRLFRDLIQYV